jgi:hypothetical protein
MMPTDRLTIRSTIFDNSVNEKIAAAVMLKTPAMVVASKMELSIGSMLKPLCPDSAAFYRVLLGSTTPVRKNAPAAAETGILRVQLTPRHGP